MLVWKKILGILRITPSEDHMLPLHHLQEFDWSRTLHKCLCPRPFDDYFVSSSLNAVQILFTDTSRKGEQGWRHLRPA